MLGSVVKTFYPLADMQVKAVFGGLGPVTIDIVGHRTIPLES